MKLMKQLLVIGCLLAFMLPAFGCSEDGPAEKAGKKLDQTMEQAKEAAQKLSDDAAAAIEKAKE
jgi:hypothetical protein